jgi:hypothetical protein
MNLCKAAAYFCRPFVELRRNYYATRFLSYIGYYRLKKRGMQFLVFLSCHFPNLYVSSPQVQTLGDERRVANLGFLSGFYYKLPHVNGKKLQIIWVE